jgi:hypothetical protein
MTTVTDQPFDPETPQFPFWLWFLAAAFAVVSVVFMALAWYLTASGGFLDTPWIEDAARDFALVWCVGGGLL